MDILLAIFALHWLALSWALASSTSTRNYACRAAAAVTIVWLAVALAALADGGSGAA